MVDKKLAHSYRKKVFILTYCRNIKLLYGTLMLFDSLRMGFPNAEINVIDNVSLPQARVAIKEQCKKNNCSYHQLERNVRHEAFIESIVDNEQGTVIFLDPDISFWKSVEDWLFDKPMAGRLIPKFLDEYSRTSTMPRLHTSFLWIQNTQSLRERINRIKNVWWNFAPWCPVTLKHDNEWVRYDTGASLYAAIKDEVHTFTEEELNAYDHLFCGSHIDVVLPKMKPDDRTETVKLHQNLLKDRNSLKGVWRRQEKYFAKRAIENNPEHESFI